MKIRILTIGSRGDVQPFIAIAQGLQARGHDVVLCTARKFKAFVESNGVSYAPMSDAYLSLLDTQQVNMEKPAKGFGMIKQVKPMIAEILRDAWNASRDAEVLLFHPKTLAGYSIAEKLDIPAYLTMALPAYTPTRSFINPIFPPISLGGAFNRLSYSVLRFSNTFFSDILNDWRATLGLPKRGRFASDTILPNGDTLPTLYPISTHVVPRPDDYPSTTHLTGYWFMNQESDWQPPRALENFIKDGTPPVYIGFGSMVSANPEQKAKTILQAVELSGQRAIVATGWGGMKLTESPKNVYLLDSAPHDWLFPQMSAVVHHGGAGTTASGLRAGVPSIICPFFGDQPFWGKRLHQLGVSPAPIPQSQLVSDSLANAIREATTNATLRENARILGEKIRAENGIETAIRIIEKAH